MNHLEIMCFSISIVRYTQWIYWLWVACLFPIILTQVPSLGKLLFDNYMDLRRHWNAWYGQTILLYYSIPIFDLEIFSYTWNILRWQEYQYIYFNFTCCWRYCGWVCRRHSSLWIKLMTTVVISVSETNKLLSLPGFRYELNLQTSTIVCVLE